MDAAGAEAFSGAADALLGSDFDCARAWPELMVLSPDAGSAMDVTLDWLRLDWLTLDFPSAGVSGTSAGWRAGVGWLAFDAEAALPA